MNQIDAVSYPSLRCDLPGQFEHLRSDIHASHMCGPAASELRNEASGAASDIADAKSLHVSGTLHHPIKTLVNVLAQPAIESAAEGALFSCINRVEVLSYVVPEPRHLRHR